MPPHSSSQIVGRQQYIHLSSTEAIRDVFRKTAEALQTVEEHTCRPEQPEGANCEGADREGVTAIAPSSRPLVDPDLPIDLGRGGVDVHLLREQIGLISQLASRPELVPYALLRNSCAFLRSVSGGSGPWLHQLLRGTEIVLPKPLIRERSPELEARLAALQEALERRQYSALVQDVDPTAGKEEDGPAFMPTFKEQAAFGLNVVTLMATGYVVGHAAMAALDKHNKHLHPVGGCIGLVLCMLVEVVLFAIRADHAERKARSSPPGFRGMGSAPSAPAPEVIWAKEPAPAGGGNTAPYAPGRTGAGMRLRRTPK